MQTRSSKRSGPAAEPIIAATQAEPPAHWSGLRTGIALRDEYLAFLQVRARANYEAWMRLAQCRSPLEWAETMVDEYLTLQRDLIAATERLAVAGLPATRR